MSINDSSHKPPSELPQGWGAPKEVARGVRDLKRGKRAEIRVLIWRPWFVAKVSPARKAGSNDG